MSNPKYNVGDKVRIKKREGKATDYPYFFISDMVDLAEKVFTIQKINQEKEKEYFDKFKYNNGDYYSYILLEDDRKCNWHSSMFEPISSITEIKDLTGNENVTLFGFKGHVTIAESALIIFPNHEKACTAIKQKVPAFNALAITYEGDIEGYFPTFPSLHQLTLFVNALKEIEQNNFTSQNKNQNENNEIRFQKPKTSIERGTVPEGHQICGKRSRSSIIVGYLSNRAWNL